jgi:hypothetical protein
VRRRWMIPRQSCHFATRTPTAAGAGIACTGTCRKNGFAKHSVATAPNSLVSSLLTTTWPEKVPIIRSADAGLVIKPTENDAGRKHSDAAHCHWKFPR